MYPIVLTISTGRCGTTFLEKTFEKNFSSETNWISHEYLKQNVTKVGIFHRCYSEECQRDMVNNAIVKLLVEWRKISTRGPVVDFGWTMRSLIPLFYKKFGNQFKVIYLHRHPVSVAASLTNIGAYSTSDLTRWTINPTHPRALYPRFKSRWRSMTPFEKCLYLWLEVNGYALEIKKKYSELDLLEVRSDDLFKSDQALNEIARFTGFRDQNVSVHRSKDENRRDLFAFERRPIRSEWKLYQKHPEVIELAQELGYCMEVEYVETFIRKYQLPHGILPYIRYKTGYWSHKERIGKLIRSAGLRN